MRTTVSDTCVLAATAAPAATEAARDKRDTESGKTVAITKSAALFRSSHKWIAAVILAIAAIVGVLTVGARFYLGRPANQINSIAVLPLENLSRDQEQEYFSDGMTRMAGRRAVRSPGVPPLPFNGEKRQMANSANRKSST